MTWYSKVVWGEGMAVRPQHFQQQDRYFEALLRGRCEALRPHAWGVVRLGLNQGALKRGTVEVERASGVLPDGTPFSIPDRDEAPPPLEIDPQWRNSRVFLALPLSGPETLEVRRNGHEGPVRFQAEDYHVRDSVEKPGSRDPELIEVGRRRFRLLPERMERGDYAAIGIARVQERRADGLVLLDEGYIPPCMDSGLDPVLRGFIDEIEGLLRQRGVELAARSPRTNAQVAQTQDFLRLLLLNRAGPLFSHLAKLQSLHPETLFRDCLQLAGELATFSRRERRPPGFPDYQHEDLQASFQPLMAELRLTLSPDAVSAIQLPLVERVTNYFVSPIKDPELLQKARFVLVVQADMVPDQVRNQFPGLLKISAVEKIRDLVGAFAPGVPVTALGVAPQQLPFHEKGVYFELDRRNEFWEQLHRSQAFALHIGERFPGLEMSFWAIPERTEETI